MQHGLVGTFGAGQPQGFGRGFNAMPMMMPGGLALPMPMGGFGMAAGGAFAQPTGQRFAPQSGGQGFAPAHIAPRNDVVGDGLEVDRQTLAAKVHALALDPDEEDPNSIADHVQRRTKRQETQKAASRIIRKGEDLSGVMRAHNGQEWAVMATIAPRGYNASKDDMVVAYYGGFKSKKKATSTIERWRQLEPRIDYELVRTRILGEIPRPRNAGVKTHHANKELDGFLNDYDKQQKAPQRALDNERQRVKKDKHDTLFPIKAFTAGADGKVSEGKIVD